MDLGGFRRFYMDLGGFRWISWIPGAEGLTRRSEWSADYLSAFGCLDSRGLDPKSLITCCISELSL